MLTVILNLGSLAIGALFLVAGVRLLGRRMRRIAASPEMGCGNCGTPASGLTDFTCPRCHVDVRHGGLYPRNAPAGDMALRIVGLTILLMIFALVFAGFVRPLLAGAGTSRQFMDYEWHGGGVVRGLRLAVDGESDRTTGSWAATRHAAGEVSLRTGDVAMIEVKGPAPLRVTVTDTSGRVVFSDRPLDAEAVRDWLAAALPPTTATPDELRVWSIALDYRLAKLLNPDDPRQPPTSGEVAEAFSGSGGSTGFSSGARGGHASVGWQLAVVLVPALWLAGVAAFAHVRRRPA